MRALPVLFLSVLSACTPETPPRLGDEAQRIGSPTNPPSTAASTATLPDAPWAAPSSSASDTSVATATAAAPAPPASATATAVASRKDGIDRVELAFRDASVPPPHHRSYVITLTPTTIRKVVDSYGDVLSDDSSPLGAGEFDRLVDGLNALGLRGGAPPEDGCTGGTGRLLKVFAGSKVVLDARSARCGGRDGGPLARATKWISSVEQLAPESLSPGSGPSSSKDRSSL